METVIALKDIVLPMDVLQVYSVNRLNFVSYMHFLKINLKLGVTWHKFILVE